MFMKLMKMKALSNTSAKIRGLGGDKKAQSLGLQWFQAFELGFKPISRNPHCAGFLKNWQRY